MRSALSLALASVAFVTPTTAQVVQDDREIAEGLGGLVGPLDGFGDSAARIGDLDGDGVDDLAVGTLRDGDSGVNAGAVWILFMNADGTVKDEQKINALTGGFGGTLITADYFGSSVAAIGDIDGDSVTELVVGARGDDTGRPNGGAVWLLYMNTDGTVKDQRHITEGESNFHGGLADGDAWGQSVAPLGDLDGNGVVDFVAGAPWESDGPGDYAGALWVVFLESDGTVKGHQKISALHGGFTGELGQQSYFGYSLASMGDFDGDGVRDIAVGGRGSPYTGEHPGNVWILFLETDGTVASHARITPSETDFYGCVRTATQLANGDITDAFGYSVACLGDLDEDGNDDLAVGAPNDAGQAFDQLSGRGAVWILLLDSDASVKGFHEIGDQTGGFGPLEDRDHFGECVADLGDLDGDGSLDLLVGTPGYILADMDSVRVLFLDKTAPMETGVLGTRVCSPAVPNSSGLPGSVLVTGCNEVGRNCVTLWASGLPAGSNIGYFIMGTGTNTFTPPGSAGPICVSSGIKRYLPPVSNTNELPGGFSRVVGTAGTVSGNITAGSTWGFQAWHRDSAAGTSNLTDAVRVDFR